MKSFLRYILVAFFIFGTASCVIDNDMAYPKTEGVITAFEVDGQKSVSIDPETRRVEFVLTETADISALRIDTLGFNDGAVLVGPVPEYLDLSQPVTLTLEVYHRQYEWTVSATQPIERYIHVNNQVGETLFNVEDRTAFIYVTEYQPLKSVTFLDMKLEPEGSEVVSTTGFRYDDGVSIKETFDCEFPMTLECVMLRTFKVRHKDKDMDMEWTVRVQKKEIGLQIMSVNAFARYAEVKGAYDGTGVPVLEYRKAADSEWIVFTESVVASVGLSGVITGLEPETDYVVRVKNGENSSAEYPFRTEAEAQLYNMSFDDWYLTGKIWYPYAQGAEPSVWDSANPGAATFIGSSTSPEESMVVSGKAVRMESKYAVIAFAAGNIYTGKFGRIAGVGAELDWGVPFTSRPKALKGYYSYVPKPIDNVDKKMLAADNLDGDALLGTMDKCQIQVILTDWDAPFHVNTSKGQFVDIENDEHIIAFARLESDKTTDGYEEFTLNLEYRDKTRTPKYVVISACASYLGDYFTGGKGSLMHIDQFEFVY